MHHVCSRFPNVTSLMPCPQSVGYACPFLSCFCAQPYFKELQGLLSQNRSCWRSGRGWIYINHFLSIQSRCWYQWTNISNQIWPNSGEARTCIWIPRWHDTFTLIDQNPWCPIHGYPVTSLHCKYPLSKPSNDWVFGSCGIRMNTSRHIWTL